MQLENTTQKFGLLTKTFHWLIFLLVVIEYFLVYRREYFPKGSVEKAQYMMLHKSFGVCVLLLALLMLVSRYIGKRPLWPLNMSSFQIFIAKLTHFLLYALLIIQPVSGVLMSAFGGYKVSLFNLYTLPIQVAENKDVSGLFYNLHVWSSYFIIGIVALHIFGALYHHFVEKDEVLTRML